MSGEVGAEIAARLAQRAEREKAVEQDWAEAVKPAKASGQQVRVLGANPQDAVALPNTSPGGASVPVREVPGGAIVDGLPRIAQPVVQVVRRRAITYDLLFAVLSGGQWQVWLVRGEDAPVQVGSVPIRPQYPTWFVCYTDGVNVSSISGSGAVTWDNVASANLSSVSSVAAISPNQFAGVIGFVRCLGAVTGLASPVVPVGVIPGNLAGTATATLTAASGFGGEYRGRVGNQEPVSQNVGVPVSANFNATVQKVWSNFYSDWEMVVFGLPQFPGGSFEGVGGINALGESLAANVAGNLAVTFTSAPVFGILSANKSEAWPWVTTPYCSYYGGQAIIKPPEPLPNQGTDPRTIVTQLCDAILPTAIPRQSLNWRDAVAIHLVAETPPSRHTPAEIANPLLNFDTKGGYLWAIPGSWKTDLKAGSVAGTVNRYAYDYNTNTLGAVRESVDFTLPQINPADYGVEAGALEILGIAAYSK